MSAHHNLSVKLYALTVTAALVATGCSSSSSSKSASSGKGMCPDGTIKIGIAKAKTGGFAAFDLAGGNGSLVAIDQLNAQGGVSKCKLNAEWSDTKSDPAIGSQVTVKLIADGAKVVIAPSDFDIGIAASQAAKSAKVFAISPEASSTDWPTAAGPYFFVQAITENDLGAAQAIFANGKKWKTGFSVINDSFNFFKTTEKVFNAQYHGKVASRVAVADDATDYSAVISRIRSTSPAPDFIYLADYYPHVGTFIKQLRDSGIRTPVLGNPTYSSPELATAVGPSRMSQVYYASQSFYEGKGAAPEVKDFVSRYKAKFGSFPPNANAIAGYEGVLLLAKALEQAGTTGAAELSAAMGSLTDVKLPGAEVYKFESGHTVRSATIVGFDGEGSPRQLETLDPTKASK